MNNYTQVLLDDLKSKVPTLVIETKTEDELISAGSKLTCQSFVLPNFISDMQNTLIRFLTETLCSELLSQNSTRLVLPEASDKEAVYLENQGDTTAGYVTYLVA